MRPASPAMQALAARLLDRESGADPSAEQLAVGAETACRKLAERLEPMIGKLGFRVVLRRALHLTRDEFPLIEGVTSTESGDVLLDGLDARVQGREAKEVREAVEAVLARFLGLVAYYMGDDLTARIVSRAWPDLLEEEAV